MTKRIITFLGTPLMQMARQTKLEKSRWGMLSVYCTFHILINVLTRYVKPIETFLSDNRIEFRTSNWFEPLSSRTGFINYGFI